MYGKLALKVRGKLLACLAIHKSAEPESLVVRIDLEQRAGLLEEAPETYYITDHYRNYPAVLVRLSRIPITNCATFSARRGASLHRSPKRTKGRLHVRSEPACHTADRHFFAESIILTSCSVTCGSSPSV